MTDRLMKCTVPLLASFALAAGGCSLKQTVNPAPTDLQAKSAEKIAIIENPAVRMEGFDDAIERSLERCGFTVEMLPKGTAKDARPLVITYTANWSWDLDLYLSYAKIDLYRQGKHVADATYDATWGGAHLGKFVKADEKVDSLIYEMFPGRAPPPPPRAETQPGMVNAPQTGAMPAAKPAAAPVAAPAAPTAPAAPKAPNA
jgi:hypothetical protein